MLLNKTTGAEIASIASRAMNGDALTDSETRRMAASVLSQVQDDFTDTQAEALNALVIMQGSVIAHIDKLCDDETGIILNNRMVAISKTEIDKGFAVLYRAIEVSLDATDESR